MNNLKIGFLSISVAFFLTLSSNVFGQWVQVSGPYHGSCVGFAACGGYLFAGTGSGVFRSSDSGATWVRANTGLLDTVVSGIAASGSYVYVGTGSGIGTGISRSTDLGASWHAIDSGLPLIPTELALATGNSLVVTGANVFAALAGGSFHSSDNGASWLSLDSVLIGGSANSFYLSGEGIFADCPGGLFLSTNNGTSWTSFNSHINGQNFEGLAISDSVNFILTTDSVLRSTNSGKSWTAGINGSGNITVMDFATDGTNLFAGTYREGVFLSTDDGATWNGVSSGIEHSIVTSIFVDGPYVFAGNTEGEQVIWRRLLSDITYNPVDTAKNHVLAANDTVSVLFSDTGRMNLTLAGDSDQSRTHRINFVNSSSDTLTILNAALTDTNNRFSIRQFLPGVPDTVFPGDTFSVIVNFLGDNSGTVYLDTIVLTIDPNQVISSFYVYLKGNSFSSAPAGVAQNSQISSPEIQCYPNPLTQSTKISFTLPESGEAEVTIVNLLGSEVARLFSGSLSAGEHSFEWDAGQAAAGTYFCALRTINGVQRVAMVVER